MKPTARPGSDSDDKLHGRDIVEEILHNSTLGQFEFTERVIVPAVYHIYLHPEDLDRLKPVERVIRDECMAALNKRLRQLNRKRFGRATVQYGIQAQDWDVQLFADHHDDAVPGSVKVASSLAPAEESDLVGVVTTRVKRAPGAAPPTPSGKTTGTRSSPAPNTDARETRRAPSTTARKAAAAAWASIVWRDDDGERSLQLSTPIVKAGRGAQMDLVIRNASEAVSRSHFTIRRDDSGKAWITDGGSANGTEVNGVPLVPNTETPLPDAARISLAMGSVNLEFTRRSA